MNYRAQLNLENPLGTMQSIEYVLRRLDRRAEEEREYAVRQEKALAEYKTQLGRPFEHEQRLKDLMLMRAELNSLLDLDKHDTQTLGEAVKKDSPMPGFVGRLSAKESAMSVDA